MVDDHSRSSKALQVKAPAGYRLVPGSTLDRALLLKTMRRTYQELHPERTFDHLAQTVDAYLSNQTPLWWIEIIPNESVPGEVAGPSETVITTGFSSNLRQAKSQPKNWTGRPHLAPHPIYVGGLWMGTATDQVSGLRHAHIFLLYIQPAHRRRGLGRCLMQQAEAWAQARGDRQISLQVFEHNAAALNLYQGLGYQPQSIALVKALPSLEPSPSHSDKR